MHIILKGSQTPWNLNYEIQVNRTFLKNDLSLEDENHYLSKPESSFDSWFIVAFIEHSYSGGAISGRAENKSWNMYFFIFKRYLLMLMFFIILAFQVVWPFKNFFWRTDREIQLIVYDIFVNISMKYVIKYITKKSIFHCCFNQILTFLFEF